MARDTLKYYSISFKSMDLLMNSIQSTGIHGCQYSVPESIRRELARSQPRVNPITEILLVSPPITSRRSDLNQHHARQYLAQVSPLPTKRLVANKRKVISKLHSLVGVMNRPRLKFGNIGALLSLNHAPSRWRGWPSVPSLP